MGPDSQGEDDGDKGKEAEADFGAAIDGEEVMEHDTPSK